MRATIMATSLLSSAFCSRAAALLAGAPPPPSALRLDGVKGRVVDEGASEELPPKEETLLIARERLAMLPAELLSGRSVVAVEL
jgi:hypothetical protein